jgi:hypothetical protein
MMATIETNVIQFGGGSSSQFTNLNAPVPDGILLIALDTGEVKVGDGSTLYASLPTLVTLKSIANLTSVYAEGLAKATSAQASATQAATAAVQAGQSANSSQASAKNAAASAAAALAELQTIMTTLGKTIVGGSVNANLMSVTLASGSITSDIAYLDLVLPTGYALFELELIDFGISASDNLAAAFSADDGVSFWCDTIHQDTYLSTYWDTVNAQNQTVAESLALFTGSTATKSDASIKLWPGDSTSSYRARNSLISPESGGVVAYELVGSSLNSAATVAPTYARVNLIRILPVGHGDCNPPTSGTKITSGSYILKGFPNV